MTCLCEPSQTTFWGCFQNQIFDAEEQMIKQEFKRKGSIQQSQSLRLLSLVKAYSVLRKS